MYQTKKTTLLLLTALSLTAYVGTAQSITAEEKTPPAQSVWTEQAMLDGLESLWWYEEERSLVLFAEGNFYYVELRNVTTLSEAVAAMQQPAFTYTVDQFFPEEGRMAVSRTTINGFAEEYTVAPDGQTMEVNFPDHGEKYIYVYAGEAADMADVLLDKMSGGGAIEVPE